MGGVWCKTDKAQRSYSTKESLNTTISQWTNHVRQAYRKPKHHHRPPRPPQKPARSNERLTISAPTLVSEVSSDGWRTATLIVPEAQAAPVPPPRKKRKRNMELNRSAVSMDDLNQRTAECLSKSTISLPDKCSDTLGSGSSSSTLVVTPILESRVNHEKNEENKENIKNLEEKIEEEDEEEDQPEIVPIEKETLFTSRNFLHSNLGYVDKLSAISEVSAESGFDDKADIVKCSESGSVTSGESVPRETGLNILAHIHDISRSSVSQAKESVDVREKTAVSKKEWLQNILTGDPEPYLMSRDAKELRRGSDGVTKTAVPEAVAEQPNSLPNHLLPNGETQTSAVETVNKTSPPSDSNPHPDNTNHSVLLDIIRKHKESDEQKTPHFLDHREESIFLTNTKTNIIYKSLSSDKLTDDYDISYSETFNTVPKLSDFVNRRLSDGDDRTTSTGKSHLSDYSFQTPKLVESDTGLNSLLENKRSNIVSSFDFKEIKNRNYVSESHTVNSSSKQVRESVVNGVTHPNDQINSDRVSDESNHNDKINKDALVKKDSLSSSRKSSITDSLHEFEMSIYDMLKESKKNENSSDEEESLKAVK